jgi:hypothetical protein
MKELSNEAKQPIPIIKLMILAIINAALFIYLLPIAAADFATGIPRIVIIILYAFFCFLIVFCAKRKLELLILCVAAFLITLLFLRVFGEFFVVDRYIAIVDNPDVDERHLHLTDRLGINLSMLGFLIASGFAAFIRLCTLIDKAENEKL